MFYSLYQTNTQRFVNTFLDEWFSEADCSFIGVVHCDVSGGMEQERRTSGRTSIETFEAVHAAF